MGNTVDHPKTRATGRLSVLAPGLAAGLTMLVLLGAGCRHSPERERYETEILTPLPPPFVAGPMAVLLTNTGGFSARVTLDSEALPGGPGAPTGHLLGRGTQLLFAPDPKEPGRKQIPAGLSFIWDVAANRGFVLSEALQGYAPVTSPAQVTNVSIRVEPVARETVGGHPCVAEEAVLQTSDGVVAVFRALCATDLKGFPLRVTSGSNTPPLAVSFSKVRLELPPAELFAPPAGFTQYSTPEALADEIAVRQRNLHRKPGEDYAPWGEPGSATSPR